MRTLNRPMFRYGGPIKEGVMNGIREPKKDGGSMSPQFNTGLVGDERYPKTDGREKHAFFLAPMAYTGLMAAGRALAPRAIAAGAKRFGKGLMTSPGAGTSVFGKGLTKMQRLKNLLPSQRFRSTIKPSVSINKTTGQVIDKGVPGKLSIGETLRSPELIGRAIRENPFTAFGVAGQVKNIPDIAGGIFDVGKSAVQGGTNYLLGTEFGKGDDKNTEGAVLEKLTTESIKEVLTPAEEKALAASKSATAEAAKIASASFAKAEKEKRIEGYREIMDIKGMNKDAAYDSLIAASQAVSGSGDFKGDIKDGSLINKIIQSTSKNFDKVSDTKKAINSLILKGEIEKDLATAKPGTQYKAASDYASMQGVSIDQAYKDLGFSKVNNIATNLTAVNKSLGQTSTSSETLDQAIRLSQDGVIPKILADDTKMLELEKDPNFKDSITLFQETVRENQLGPGVYIIGTEAFQIDEEGNQSQLY